MSQAFRMLIDELEKDKSLYPDSPDSQPTPPPFPPPPPPGSVPMEPPPPDDAVPLMPGESLNSAHQRARFRARHAAIQSDPRTKDSLDPAARAAVADRDSRRSHQELIESARAENKRKLEKIYESRVMSDKMLAPWSPATPESKFIAKNLIRQELNLPPLLTRREAGLNAWNRSWLEQVSKPGVAFTEFMINRRAIQAIPGSEKVAEWVTSWRRVMDEDIRNIPMSLDAQQAHNYTDVDWWLEHGIGVLPGMAVATLAGLATGPSGIGFWGTAALQSFSYVYTNSVDELSGSGMDPQLARDIAAAEALTAGFVTAVTSRIEFGIVSRIPGLREFATQRARNMFARIGQQLTKGVLGAPVEAIQEVIEGAQQDFTHALVQHVTGLDVDFDTKEFLLSRLDDALLGLFAGAGMGLMMPANLQEVVEADEAAKAEAAKVAAEGKPTTPTATPTTPTARPATVSPQAVGATRAPEPAVEPAAAPEPTQTSVEDLGGRASMSPDSIRTIGRHFRGAKIRKVDDSSISVETPGGQTVAFLAVSSIDPDRIGPGAREVFDAEVRAQGGDPTAFRAQGATVPMNGVALRFADGSTLRPEHVILIAQTGQVKGKRTIPHEVMELALRTVLTEPQIRALIRKYGDPNATTTQGRVEGVAVAFEARRPDTLLQKVRDFFSSLAGLFSQDTAVSRAVFRAIESGEAFSTPSAQGAFESGAVGFQVGPEKRIRRNLSDIESRVPTNRRLATASYAPGQLPKHPSGSSFESRSKTRPATPASFTLGELQRVVDQTLAEADSVSVNNADEKHAKGKKKALGIFYRYDDRMLEFRDLLNGALSAPESDRYWYEVWGEIARRRLSKFSKEDLESFRQVLAVTSAQEKVRPNFVKAVAVAADLLRNKQVFTDVTNANAAIAALGSSFAEGGRVKVGSFSTTMALMNAETDHIPLPVLDVIMAQVFGLDPDSAFGEGSTYELFSRLMVNLRDQVNSKLPPGADPWQTWQLQAALWVTFQRQAGRDPGTYEQGLDEVISILRKAGRKFPKNSKGESVLPRSQVARDDTAELLRPPVRQFREAHIFTLESGQDRTRAGRLSTTILGRLREEIARRQGTKGKGLPRLLQLERAHENILFSSMRRLTRQQLLAPPGSNGRQSRVINEFIGPLVNLTPASTAKTGAEGTFDLRRAEAAYGTWMLEASPILRIMMPEFVDTQNLRVVLAVLGKVYSQYAVSASRFTPRSRVTSFSPQAPNGVLGAFVTGQQITRAQLAQIATLLKAPGHQLVTRHAINGTAIYTTPNSHDNKLVVTPRKMIRAIDIVFPGSPVTHDRYNYEAQVLIPAKDKISYQQTIDDAAERLANEEIQDAEQRKRLTRNETTRKLIERAARESDAPNGERYLGRLLRDDTLAKRNSLKAGDQGILREVSRRSRRFRFLWGAELAQEQGGDWVERRLTDWTGKTALTIGELPAFAVGPKRGDDFAALNNEPVSDAEFQRILAEVQAEKPPGRTLGRPELAIPAEDEPTRELVMAVDEARKRKGVPAVRTHAEVGEEAVRRIAAGRNAEAAAILQAAAEGQAPDDTQVVIAKTIVAEDGYAAVRGNNQKQVKDAVRLIWAYRELGTTTARALRARFDVAKSPAERAQEYLTETILSPSRPQKGQLDKIKKEIEKARKKDQPARIEALNAEADKILERITKDVINIKKKLKDLGHDLDTMTTADFNDSSRVASIGRAVHTAKSHSQSRLYEWWLMSILSNPTTQSANVIGNTGFSAWELGPQRIAEAVANVFVNSPDLPTIGELAATYKAFLPGFRIGFRNAIKTFKDEVPVLTDEVGTQKLELSERRQAIPGKFGGFVRTPGRLLQAMDQFAQGITHTMVLQGVAHRRAKAEGLKPGTDKWANRILELTRERGDIWFEALSESQRLAFQEEGGALVKTALRLREDYRPLKFFLPFVTTPANIFKIGIRKTPLGTIPLAGKLTLRLTKTGYVYDRADIARDVVEQALGWGVVMALWAFVFPEDEDGLPWITGSSPYRPRGQRQLAFRVAPPMSIRIGKDKWISYSRIEPFAVALATIVDGLSFVRDAQSGEVNDVSAGFQRAWASASSQVRDKTFLRGISDILDMIEQPSQIPRWGTNFATSWVPNIVRAGARNSDTFLREQKVWKQFGEGFGKQQLDRLKYSAFPVSKWAPSPKIDLWGRPITKTAGLHPATDWAYRMMVPIQDFDTKLDAAQKIDLAILTYNNQNPSDRQLFTAPDPWITIEGKGRVRRGRVAMTDAQYEKFLRASGEMALRRLRNRRIGADVKSMELIRKAVNESRATIRRRMTREILRNVR